MVHPQGGAFETTSEGLMLLFVLWMAVGAIAGSLIGVYHCSNLGQALPRFSNPTYVSFCGGVGALAGFLMFVILARFFYGLPLFLD